MWILIILILISAPKWAFILWGITMLLKAIDRYFFGFTRKERKERIENRFKEIKEWLDKKSV